MSHQETALVVFLVGSFVAVVRIILPKIYCRHRRWVRYWFKGHRFLVVCKRCHRPLGNGRDTSHRYPDDTDGVNRGARAAK